MANKRNEVNAMVPDKHKTARLAAFTVVILSGYFGVLAS